MSSFSWLPGALGPDDPAGYTLGAAALRPHVSRTSPSLGLRSPEPLPIWGLACVSCGVHSTDSALAVPSAGALGRPPDKPTALEEGRPGPELLAGDGSPIRPESREALGKDQPMLVLVSHHQCSNRPVLYSRAGLEDPGVTGLPGWELTSWCGQG